MLWLLVASLKVSLISAASAPAASTSAPSATSSGTCTVTAYASISAAVASCTSIVIQDVTVPGRSTLDLSKLKTGSKVVFSGRTTFEYGNANYNLINIGGTDIDVSAEADAVLDGNGQAWWDGLGSNGGVAKPNHFITASRILGSSAIHDLYIQNYPVHGFIINNCANLSVYSVVLNNTAGHAPNNHSNGLAAAHNTDGFDIADSNNTSLYNSTVLNQDDCVAITSGDNIQVSNMHCDGGHGLSIGSVGGKSNNNVTNISFTSSTVLNSQNGCRIKTNYNTTGYIANITYSDIQISNISKYGIDIQEDYLNGGPTGTPSNGFTITGVNIENVRGTAEENATNYYILCGEGSCTNFTFSNISVVGGGNSSCNVQPTGDFSCV